MFPSFPGVGLIVVTGVAGCTVSLSLAFLSPSLLSSSFLTTAFKGSAFGSRFGSVSVAIFKRKIIIFRNFLFNAPGVVKIGVVGVGVVKRACPERARLKRAWL